uniref:Uncharacterized protein n=1 Tax=Macaca mulatta TaxID=9544 RepID=A0A5F8A2G0_MACMU
RPLIFGKGTYLEVERCK